MEEKKRQILVWTQVQKSFFFFLNTNGENVYSFTLIILSWQLNWHMFVFRDQLMSRYSLGSPEMQGAIQEQVQLSEREHQQHMKQQQEKWVHVAVCV